MPFCGICENGVLLMYTLEGVAVLQTSLLLMKSLSKTEVPFSVRNVFFVSKGDLFFFYFYC